MAASVNVLHSYSSQWLLGTRVHVILHSTTGSPPTCSHLEGTVYAYDITLGLAVLTHVQFLQPHPQSQEMVILPLSSVRQVTRATTSSTPSVVTSDPCQVVLQRLMQREKDAIMQRQLEMRRRGVGVSSEAQSIFDALSRTLPCKWEEKRIIVMETITIEEPYTAAACQGKDQAALQRVCKVLEGERRRLGLDS